jgi:hypothetical protein
VGVSCDGATVAARDNGFNPEAEDIVIIKQYDSYAITKNIKSTKSILRELKLKRLLKHENILGISTIILPKSRE